MYGPRNSYALRATKQGVNVTEVIESGKVVFIHYTLKNDEGEVLDSSDGGDPLFYLHGAQNIVEGLEAELSGKKVGDSLSVTVPPEKGYGERVEPGEQAFERSVFPANVDIQEGMPFHAELPNGQMVAFWVTRIEGDKVYMDPNHPLAGENLNFDVEIVRVREANDAEKAHGHPHGPEGNAAHH